ncbi:uncharacterized protein K452DRAFT_318395 [Aplosporella prunicola CBS 121167]|uniref:MARVEL domain-containing protein n=1 Tax=Aplosporella prunicola CBS 121167 TaxID=1176127 RepID=A0A6A6BGT9_9PEZI|nr:uncharacterized protein K452DRAFT_318395 [Aplosporella prunicola CBS 121167]KAF2142087.1 hypothetical protein K452DRAFT_318395 [Aplosporella prunicola CBS 121167]
MSTNEQKTPAVSITVRRPSVDSVAPSLKTPRTARFAEATAVYSPIEPNKAPFTELSTNHYAPQPQPADVGFGYLSNRASGHESYAGVEMEDTDRNYLPPPTPRSPMKSPLKSAMKSPGAPPRDFGNVLSPTFREEQVLEKVEEDTDVEQAKDLKVKTRVRIAKFILRGVNFSCSLIVLSMLASTFAIFNATKSLPPRNNLPPWAENTKSWPQITLLVIACISLFMSIVILLAYFRGGHQRAERVAVYYTVFAVAFFIFSIVMWGVGAGILNQAKTSSGNKDIWGWACKDNERRTLFEDDVDYALVCRLQDWSLVCCIIEVVVETLTIIIYGIVFYRFYSKRQLRKSMAIRDRARSDLYLAQLRSQSAPNTPGFGPPPLTPGDGWKPPPGHPRYVDPYAGAAAAEAGEMGMSVGGPAVQESTVQYPKGYAQPKPFTLQAPPIRVQQATPKTAQVGFDGAPASPDTPRQSVSPPLAEQHQYQPHSDVSPPESRTPSPPLQSPSFAPQQQQQAERINEHVGAAPGEQVYESVPIPGAYTSPSSPSGQHQHQQMGGFDFGTGR